MIHETLLKQIKLRENAMPSYQKKSFFIYGSGFFFKKSF
jgi:hypothetical protein